MGIKAFLSKAFAKWVGRKNAKWRNSPIESQETIFKQLIEEAKSTVFGKEHYFNEINNYQDFVENVPISSYEGLKPYIEKIKHGENDILWPGKPLYLSKTSGTTSGAKYIPLTKESMPAHIKAARDAILSYIAETGKSAFVDGKMIFLQGNPELDKKGAIPVGRLSGIVAHYVPNYLQRNRMPSYKVNCIADWESKVEAIAKETMNEDMTLISGIPPWVQMYFEKLIELSGKKSIMEIFPNFSLFIYGGVNYEPYRSSMEKLIGKKVDSIELYPASEGFIAYQDSQEKEGMLLLVDAGIFYEFIAVDDFENGNYERISLRDVELGVNYVLILSTNAGLWAYNIGDTVKFTSRKPFRIKVTGRIKHFTSAFGEHVIAEEVEKAISSACLKTGTQVNEFHLAPEVNPSEGELPYHEWFVEFAETPKDLKNFATILDKEMVSLNPYYDDLISGKVLHPLKIRPIKKDGFNEFMKEQGKLGGQNKLPRLSNDRKIADQLMTKMEN